MNSSLNSRFSFSFITLTIAIVVCLSTVLLLQFRSSIRSLARENSVVFSEKLQESMFQRGESMVTILAENLTNPIYQLDMQAIHDLLIPVLNNKDVVAVVVFNEHGKVIHDGSEVIAQYGKALNDKKTINGILLSDQLIRQSENNNIISVTKPIWIGDDPIGGVKVQMSLSRIIEDLHKMKLQQDRN